MKNLFYDLPNDMQIEINKIRFREAIQHLAYYNDKHCIGFYEFWRDGQVNELNDLQISIRKEILTNCNRRDGKRVSINY